MLLGVEGCVFVVIFHVGEEVAGGVEVEEGVKPCVLGLGGAGLGEASGGEGGEGPGQGPEAFMVRGEHAGQGPCGFHHGG